MMNFTEADVQRTMDALIAEGADDADPGLHASWRCFDKVRYPEPCTCIRQAAEDILIAVADPMRDRWLDDIADDWEADTEHEFDSRFADGVLACVERLRALRSGGDR